MRELKYACIRYCPHLGHNVIMEGRYTDAGGVRLECLNKADCGYEEKGCRNSLLNFRAEKTERIGTEVG